MSFCSLKIVNHKPESLGCADSGTFRLECFHSGQIIHFDFIPVAAMTDFPPEYTTQVDGHKRCVERKEGRVRMCVCSTDLCNKDHHPSSGAGAASTTLVFTGVMAVVLAYL